MYEESWYQATLPIREGGLGLISDSNIAPVVYLSYIRYAIPLYYIYQFHYIYILF